MSERTARLVSGAALCTVLVGCSSSGSSPAALTSPTTSGGASTAAANSSQNYLDAVNALCDGLLPKVIKATHGGSIDIPASKYLAEWPAHKRLLDGFDAHLVKIPVPVTAQRKLAALTTYVRFADKLDAARLAAARKGQAAYSKEVHSEAGVENDPSIAALATAGFNNSCTAR